MKKISSVQDMHVFAGEVARGLLGGEILGLQGDLGTGKTEFVRGLAEALGSKDMVKSPSFTLLNHYRLDKLGTGRLDKLGTGRLDKLGTGRLDKLGTGRLDKLGTGRLDKLGTGRLDKLGTGRLDHHTIKHLIHVDLYRLDKLGTSRLEGAGADVLEHIGLDEWLERDDVVVVIEWPELLLQDVLKMRRLKFSHGELESDRFVVDEREG